MRGEEPWDWPIFEVILELPPHARRRAMTIYTTRDEAGITSACAEKSIPTLPPISLHRNYLRMRGEELLLDPDGETTEELPPHARRRGAVYAALTASHGITSACAEKRNVFHHVTADFGNYLRMRGEEGGEVGSRAVTEELPPHARRREGQEKPLPGFTGITSACAEKRWLPFFGAYGKRNYLRMRGEERSSVPVVAT